FLLPIKTYFGQDARLDQRRVQLAQLQAVNDDLRSEVARLATTDGVREAAREELGFVEPGERRESVLDLPPVPTDLPDGWPYSVVEGITALRRNPPPASPATQP
ncbi:MAG TPA: septum formation initiator family protein, partial [Ilumatobacter sp.]|nr:septum formation initiator family protein [Ilumatobacter sp.]